MRSYNELMREKGYLQEQIASWARKNRSLEEERAELSASYNNLL